MGVAALGEPGLRLFPGHQHCLDCLSATCLHVRKTAPLFSSLLRLFDLPSGHVVDYNGLTTADRLVKFHHGGEAEEQGAHAISGGCDGLVGWFLWPRN